MNRLSVGRTNVTDRQTDGRAIAYSEREREFTFANHKLGGFCVGLEIFLADSPLPIHSSKLSSAFKPRLAYSAVAELLLQELCNLLRWATVPQESGPKVRVLYPSPLGFGGAGSPSNTVAWAKAYLCTKWHLNPCSHLAATDMGKNCAPLREGRRFPI